MSALTRSSCMRSKVASILILATVTVLVMRGQVGAARISLGLPSLPASTMFVTGSAMPRDVDTGTPSLLSDRLVIQLSNVEAPPAGFALQCYLLAGATGISCGELTVAGGAVNKVQDFPGNNLVENYNSVRMLWEQLLFEDTIPAAALVEIREVV